MYKPSLTLKISCAAAAGVLATAAFLGFRPAKMADTGITVPAGFTTTIVADTTGRARHMAVTASGDIYIKLERLKRGKGIVRLHDSNGDGVYDQQTSFGNYAGTGIYLKNGYLYASSNKEVFRYALDDKELVKDPENPEKIVTGLADKGQHNSKSIVLDDNGNLYVNIGAYSNSCQENDRAKGSMGMKDCPILRDAGGIWQFKSNQPNQSYAEGLRYATGLRNVVGLDWNKEAGALFVMQHGRDQLNNLFPELYDSKMSAELPSECMFMVKQGDNAGWPYVYYDHLQKKKILAPEYGGDGKKEGPAQYLDPVAAFPGHLAPNGLLFYTGKMFPEKYRNGAFIAFHGSWNRSPEKQEGFFVAFVPFRNGKPSGNWEIFANGFAGTDVVVSPGNAKHRPCGLAQAPDGSLLVSDDVKGTIYRISYK
jgi:glucose/arabinose dehydrogenase